MCTRMPSKRDLYLRKRALYLRERALYLRKRALDLRKRALDLRKRAQRSLYQRKADYRGIWSSVGDTEIFCGDMGLFCGDTGLFCRPLCLEVSDHRSFTYTRMPSTREMCTFANESYISAKEPYVSAKGPYISAKEPYISAKEPYINGPLILELPDNRSCRLGCPAQERCIQLQKCPISQQKSPVSTESWF